MGSVGRGGLREGGGARRFRARGDSPKSLPVAPRSVHESLNIQRRCELAFIVAWLKSELLLRRMCELLRSVATLRESVEPRCQLLFADPSSPSRSAQKHARKEQH